MSSYRVLLFAGLRDALGPSVDVALPGPVTVGDLLAGDEVALLPPVGGG